MSHPFLHSIAPLLLLLAGPLIGVLLVIKNWKE